MEGEKTTLLDPDLAEFNSAALNKSLNSWGRDYRVEGYFGQLTADYQDKYYASASLRRDGSSVFHPDHRWGTFWSLGASWRINQEEFMKDIKWIDNLKLRVSYGAQGNDYLYLPNTNYRAYTPYTDLYEISTNGASSLYGPIYKGNKEITWEKNHNFDLGLEFSLWNGIFAGELDFFSRRTTDMLFNLPISSTTGFSTEPVNLGAMRNTGFEFNLTSNVYTSKDISVQLGVNGTTYKNKITELPEKFKEDGISRGYRIIKEGGSIYDYYLVKYAGVDPKTGDALYYIWDSEKKEFTAQSSENYAHTPTNRQKIGSALPALAGGFFLNSQFYGFDFSMQFSYRIGGKIYDSVYQNLMHTGSSMGVNWHKDILKHWSTENTNTDIPRLQYVNQSLVQASDRFIIDGSYLTINNLTFGYTLPKSVLKKIGVQNLRLYFAADNLALLSKRKGLDPRISITGTQDISVNSAVRALSFGVNLSL